MTGLTFSGLTRAERCPSSCALDQVRPEEMPYDARDRGTAIHAYIARAVIDGAADAMGDVPEEFRAHAESVDLTGLDASTVAPEVSYVLDVDAGTARELGRGLERAYPDVGPMEIVGTVDLVGLIGDDGVRVVEWKTGHGWLPPIADDLQVLAEALAAARAYGRDSVHAERTVIQEDGTRWTQAIDLDALALMETHIRFQRLAAAVEEARDRRALGQALTYREGQWCRYCPAYPVCPAKWALIRAVTQDPDEWAARVGAITPESAGDAYRTWKAASKALERIGAALYAYARETPIPLGDGMELREVETTRESLDGRTVYGHVSSAYGDEAAQIAVELDASKASIERVAKAIQAAAKARGEKVTQRAITDDILAVVRERGGIHETKSTTIREVRITEEK